MYEYTAKVIDVTDGDTFNVLINVGFKIMFEATVRLTNIDTPEVKFYKDRYVYEEEIAIGKEIKQWLTEKILGKEIRVRTYKEGTNIYGRYSADVWYMDGDKEVHLNEEMLSLGFDKGVVRQVIEQKLAEENN